MGKNGKKWEKGNMPEELKDMIIYAGEFNKQLDEKRRVTIPAKWRFQGDDSENSYLAMPTTYNSISILPPKETAALMEKISKISRTNPEKRRALSKWMASSCTFGCDKQGRVMLDESILRKAKITKEVQLVGMGTTFEIWDPQVRKDFIGDDDDLSSELSLLEELGL